MTFYYISDVFGRMSGFGLIGYKILNNFVLCFNVNPSCSDPGLNLLESIASYLT